MVFEHVKVINILAGETSWMYKGSLSLHETGTDAELALHKNDSGQNAVGLKIRSVGAALQEDPEDAIKAGATAIGVAIAKMAIGSVTGQRLGYVRYDNTYAKDFGKEIQRQENKRRQGPPCLWRQQLSLLEDVKQRDRMIRLTISEKEQYLIMFSQTDEATEAMNAISAAWGCAVKAKKK